MNITVENKSALIGGSTQGIGWASAKQLAESGARVILISRNEEQLQECVELLPNQHLNHEFLVANFSHPNQVKDQIEKYVEANGGVHILVNNTGGPPGGQAIDADPEAFRVAFNQHLICNQILAQAVVPFMKSEAYGRIINIISTSVKIPLANLGVSNSVRGAVASWAKTLANELGQFGITVNNVLPGATKTGRLDSIVQSKAEKTSATVEETERGFLSSIPAGRFAQPEELGYLVTFLASDHASYINGTSIPVDGGRTGSI